MAAVSKTLEFSFPAPRSGGADVLIIAGEHSGDEHAARMTRSLLKRQPDLKVAAIGGRHLEEAGAQLLFDLTEFSVVGFVEVIKHLRPALRLLDEIVRWIAQHRPRAVCFVDYPGLNLKIAEKLFELGISAKAGGPVKLLYYISPQVWAWKKKRKFKMARLLDSLAVIFPFEVEVFDNTDLDTRFVGHPFLAEGYDLPVRYDPDGPILLLPGSRHQAVSRIAPLFFEAFHLCLKERSKLKAVCIYPTDALKAELEAMVAGDEALRSHVEFVPNDRVVNARAVLTSSGTMSLNCALASVPGAIAYRMNALTYWMGRFLISVPFIGIANLILNRAMYPELIQGAASAKALAKELLDSFEQPDRIRQTRTDSAALREMLDRPSAGGPAVWLLEKLG